MDGVTAIPLQEKEPQEWDHPWKTNEIRKHSANWTLAGDIGLLNHLQEFSHQLISRTHEAEKLVDDLVHCTKRACAKVNNVINDFQMLSNIQFVENRVYDEEVEEPVIKENLLEFQKTKEQREADMLPRVKQALELGLVVLDEAFHKIQVDETSDSEEEERGLEGRIVLEPKDPYENRPLPYIIGSEEFLNDDYVGVRDLCGDTVEGSAEDESISESSSSSSSISEEEFEESPLLDNTQHVKTVERVPNKNFVLEKSDSESSDLFEFGGDENNRISPSESFEERKLQNNEQKSSTNLDAVVKEVKSLPTRKTASIHENIVENQVHKNDDVEKVDLFAPTEDGSIFDDEDSPFRKKSGLFSTGTAFKSRKDEIFEDDLFGSKGKETTGVPVAIETEKSTPSRRLKRDSVLFDDNDDDDGMEQDIFNTYSKSTKSFSYLKQENSVTEVENDVHSKNSRTLSSGMGQSNAVKNGTFNELNGKKKSSLFGDDSDSDDLFSTKSKAESIDYGFDDDSLFRTSTEKANKLKESGKEQPKKKPSTKVSEPSLFDDDSIDLFGPSNISSPKIGHVVMKEGSPEEIRKSKDFTFSTPVKSLESLNLENKNEMFLESTKTKELLSISPKEKESFTTHIKEQIQQGFVSGKTVSEASSSSNISLSKKNSNPVTDDIDSSVSFDEAAACPNTLNAINKDRAKVPGKRRKPTRKGRQAALQIVDSESEGNPSVLIVPGTSKKETQASDSFLPSSNKLSPSEQSVYSPQKRITKPQHLGMDKNIMSQLVSEISTSKIGKSSNIKVYHDDINDDDLFSVNKDILHKPDSFFISPSKGIESSETFSKFDSEKVNNKDDLLDVVGTNTFLDDDLFSDSTFQGLKPNIESKLFFNMDDDEEEEEEIFKPVKNVSLKSSLPSKGSENIFDEPADIFAGVHMDKYNIIPSLKYDDEDDIFGNFEVPPKLFAKSSTNEKAMKNETEQADPVDNIFEDPLSAMSSKT